MAENMKREYKQSGRQAGKTKTKSTWNNLNRDGKIPAHQLCPYTPICGLRHSGECKHKGFGEKRAFFCKRAQWIDVRAVKIK